MASAPVAGLGNPTSHLSPTLGPACVTVLMQNKPTWTVGTSHSCPAVNTPPPPAPPTPHVSGMTVPPGAVTTLVGGKPLSRGGDLIMEPAALVPFPPTNTILPVPGTVLG